MKGRENHPSANQYTKEPNIIDLLCLLDDFMIVNVLLEMEPLQMMIFGATCKRFFVLTTDLKVWRQIIRRRGLMKALLRRKGGEKNFLRLRLMQKTYLTERQRQIDEGLPALQRKAWQQLVATFKVLYKDQNTCEHLTVVYNVELKTVKCPTCCTFSTDCHWWGPRERNFVAEYIQRTQTAEEKITISRQ
jgi:hypothetical protein